MRRRPLILWLVASLSLGALACVPEELIPRPETDAGPAQQDMPTTPAADMPPPTSEPDMPAQPPADMGGGELINPLEGNPAAIMAGQMTFMSNCRGCHDIGGGPGAIAPKPLSETAAEATDAYIFTTIRDGQPLPSSMPEYGGMFSEDELWQLVSFIRSLDDA